MHYQNVSAEGKINWSHYSTRLQVFAVILQESGKDAMDGRMDSYSIYEVERAISGGEQTIRELRSKCGL